MSTPDRAEISRRNGQKSMGPKTAEGKSRSRLNALKHGMTATLPVLPGEDGDELRGRILAWTEDLGPRSLIERQSIEQAARASWQLDRIERAHVARLTANILAAQAGEDQSPETQPDIDVLGKRLFSDRRGPIQLYSTREYQLNTELRTSYSGIADDPDDPVGLVKRLESTLAGCGWMLDRWAELRARLAPGKSWQSPDKLKAIRLLGKQPLDAADDADVATIFLACYAIGPQHQSAFHELTRETTAWEWKNYGERLDQRIGELTCPTNEIEGRELLSQIVERATARLETKAEAHRQRAIRDAASAVDRFAFDGSPEGERLRRYETSAGRSLYKAIDSIVKLRLVANDRDSRPPAPFEDECNPVAAIEVDPDFQFVEYSGAELIDHPIVSTAAIVTQAEITHPTIVADSNSELPSEPTTVANHTVLRNEPTTNTDHTVLRNEPTPNTDDPILRNEPGATREHPLLPTQASTIPKYLTLPAGDLMVNGVRRDEHRKMQKAGRDRRGRNKAMNGNPRQQDRGPIRKTTTIT